MRIQKLFILIIAVSIISALLSHIFYNLFAIETTETLDMAVKVGDHFGINADSGMINFGMIMPGTYGERGVVVSNNASYSLRVIILKTGQMAEWVKVSENNFILKGNENKEVIFEVYAPENIEFGNYTGKIDIIFKKILFNK